ncbi:hypothetical protein DH2020_022013 [Rehmannia glutinosa]|uniref:Sister chromatid cohesion protein SCC4 n=1 Tax=Rehmannia glutinosa TaxID=99300 RepID=A0ABR0WC36_REHGL
MDLDLVQQLLLKSIPSCFELKCRAYSLLSQCYHLVGAIPLQKQILNKGLELSAISGDGEIMVLQLQLSACECADNRGRLPWVNFVIATRTFLCNGDVLSRIADVFATSILHVRVMQWESTSLVEESVNRCNMIWESIEPDKSCVDAMQSEYYFKSSIESMQGVKVLVSLMYMVSLFRMWLFTKGNFGSRQHCVGLLFYHELLQLFYLLRICDYKTAGQHIDKLDAVMKSDLQRMQHIQDLTNELDALNHSLSRTDLNYKDRAALAEKQTKLEEQLSNYAGNSSTGKAPLEPAYFGNVKRAWADKLELAPPPIDGEWLPKSAVYALVDLMVVVFSRPKGLFKDCQKRIQSGLQIIQACHSSQRADHPATEGTSLYFFRCLEELVQLGITEGIKEVELQHSAIWMAGVYLMLLMQFLENKVAIDLTRTEFVEAQEALVQMGNWFVRFPTILQACESIIEVLRGQYAHSVGCYDEAAFHFLEASKLTQSKSMQAMSHIYAAISYICIGDAESSAKAVDLIGPILGVIDSFVGVGEDLCLIYLRFSTHETRESARSQASKGPKPMEKEDKTIRLATGLQSTHTYLGNLQLVSQYLTVLGNLALALHDTGQAREILRSALTLARKLNDIPTQNWVLSNMTVLYQQSAEKGSEMENLEYQKRKVDDLQQRLALARSSVHHNQLIDKVKLQVHQLNEHDMKRAIAGPSKRVDLDIPESVGLSTPQPIRSSARLMDLDIGRLGKRKV